MLDTTYSVETPEGVLIRLRVAGPLVRALAWSIDAALRMVIAATLLPLGALGTLGWTLYGLLVFLLWWFYSIFFEVFQGGQTLGKRMLGIAVIHHDGTPIGWRASMLRNLLRAADLLPAIYGLGLMSILFTRNAALKGDLMAGHLGGSTESLSVTKLDLPKVLPVPPPLSLSLPEQRALISFGENAASLSSERMQELSDILEPLSGRTGSPGMNSLFSYAAWLSGARE